MVDVDAIRAGYTFSTPALELGALVTDDKSDPATPIRIPLSLLNRHGLVAGTTGTGKTKTLQVIAEQLADQGVPVFLADIKGDLSGMSAPGESNDKIASRMEELGQPWHPQAYPCEFLTLGGSGSGGTGVPVRASVTDFGPLLLSKVLGLTEIQSSSRPPTAKGVVTLLELPGVLQQPALFSSFLMWMLSELFETLPEVGDPDKPKLVFFFDEAHLLFRDASKPFLEAITQTVRLIRSKGVGIFFVTQTPEGCSPGRARPIGQPDPARAAGLHPRRRQGAQGDRVHLPQERIRS